MSYDPANRWSDCLKNFEQKFCHRDPPEIAKQIREIEEILTDEQKLYDLLIVMLEATNFDFACLKDTMKELEFAEDRTKTFLREVHRHLPQCGVASLWSSFADFGIPPDELYLNHGDERYFLGQRLAGYTIEERVAQGAAVTVFRAIREKDGLEASLRIPRTCDRQILERIDRECETRSKINVDGIPRLIETISTEDGLIAVCDFIHGARIDKSEYVLSSEFNCVSTIVRLAEILEHLHYAGFVLEDVKPSNVLITRHDQVHLVDLNSLRRVGDEIASSFASPGFMSPEQEKCEIKKIEAATDIYSLGATLEDLLTRSCKIAVITRLNHRILSGIISSAKSPSPLRRYASAGDFKKACQRFLNGEKTFSPCDLNQDLLGWRSTIAVIRCRDRISHCLELPSNLQNCSRVIQEALSCLELIGSLKSEGEAHAFLSQRIEYLAGRMESIKIEHPDMPGVLRELTEFFDLVLKNRLVFPHDAATWIEVAKLAAKLAKHPSDLSYQLQLSGTTLWALNRLSDFLREQFRRIETAETPHDREEALIRMDKSVTHYLRWGVDEFGQKVRQSDIPSIKSPREAPFDIPPAVGEFHYCFSPPRRPRRTR